MEIKLKNPTSQYDLIQSFEYLKKEVSTYFNNIPEADFFSKKKNTGWSPAENLIHLTITTNFLGIAWKIPKLILSMLYGKAKERHNFIKWKSIYKERMNTTQKSGIFSPISLDPPNSQKERKKKEIIENWETAFSHLTQDLEKINPEKFLLHKLPHPLFGPVSIQEICFLHILHIQHHCAKVEDKIKNNSIVLIQS